MPTEDLILVLYFYNSGIFTVYTWKMSLDPTPKGTKDLNDASLLFESDGQEFSQVVTPGGQLL